MPSKIISFSVPKITKNRYEILFFNKKSLCFAISYLNKNNYSSNTNSESKNARITTTNFSLNINSENNENLSTTSSVTNSQNNFSNNNISQKELSKELIKVTDAELNDIMKSIPKKNEKNCKIDFKKNDIIKFYSGLKSSSYLRLYFRYTDDESLGERFKIKGQKEFNYQKNYNISIFKIIANLLGFGSIFKNNYKKLDKDTEEEIDTILNTKVNDEVEHYKNIKKVLGIIKDKTDGYINYCIILDIKKSNLLSINRINKQININNNTFQNGGFLGIDTRLLWCYFLAFFYYKSTNADQFRCLRYKAIQRSDGHVSEKYNNCYDNNKFQYWQTHYNSKRYR